MVATKIICALSITMAVFLNAEAKPVPKVTKPPKAAKPVSHLADTPICGSSNNGNWQCIPDRAQCYQGTWYNYPCTGGTTCESGTGQCVFGNPGGPGTTSAATEPKPTTTQKATKTTTKPIPTPPAGNGGGSSKFVTYIDSTNGLSGGAAFAVDGGNSYNVINLAFWLTIGAWDAAGSWASLDSATRKDYVQKLHGQGKKILVSAFGATEIPTTAGKDPATIANNLAAFVKANDLDGADIDWEDSDAMSAGTGEAWLITFTKTLRTALPSPYIITHAPQAPYFMEGKYPNGAYNKVHQEVGNLIDWYNIQFYNQGSSTYDTCETLLNKANGWSTNTAVFELISRGYPQEKLVIGKPVTQAGASNTGVMAAHDLASCLTQAKGKGWNAGVMGWQYILDTNGNWINTLAAAL